jgi:hypothetical protein
MFKTEVLRRNGIYFESFCDYEDDWIASIKIFLASDIVCFEDRTVYCWRVHNASESHNRVAKDRYIEDFYRKYCSLRKFLLDSVAETDLTERERKAFERELQKRAMLWTLSNETGRGIEGRTVNDSTKVLKEVVSREKAAGLCKGLITHSISTTGYGVSGAKRIYHKLREAFLTFLIINNMEGAAVKLNKKYLHGRWHI